VLDQLLLELSISSIARVVPCEIAPRATISEIKNKKHCTEKNAWKKKVLYVGGKESDYVDYVTFTLL